MIFDDVDWGEVKKQSKELYEEKKEKLKSTYAGKKLSKGWKAKAGYQTPDKKRKKSKGWKPKAGYQTPDKKRKKKGKRRKYKNKISELRARVKKNVGSSGMSYFGFPVVKR